MLKKELVNLSKVYEEISNEVHSIAKKTKPKIISITDALLAQKFIEQKFYWKHDFLKIIELSKKYKVDSSYLEKLMKKYFKIEKKVLAYKNKLEKIGLKEISFGPSSIKANYKKAEAWIKVEKNKVILSIITTDKEIENKLKKDIISVINT